VALRLAMSVEVCAKIVVVVRCAICAADKLEIDT
jgi:hypothetical protein